jgi:tetratricopeptide (TPR) repeat protein
VSGVVIAAIGLYFTHSYNSRQHDARAYEARVQEMQTVEKFIPHLIGTDEAAKKGAIIAVATLGNQQLASRLGALYASPGTIDAIEVLLKTAEGETKTSLEVSLVNAYFTRGKILIDSWNNLEQAIRDYDRIQKIETDEAIKQRHSTLFLADTYNNRGYAHYLMGNHDRAIHDLQKALQVLPNYGLALRNLAVVYRDIDKLDLALTNFDLSLKSDPHPNTYTDRGILYAKQDNLDKAIEDFKRSIALNPQNFSAFYHLALAYAQQGDRPHTARAFRNASLLAPNPAEQHSLEQALNTIGSTTGNSTLLQQIQEDIAKMKYEPVNVEIRK